MGENITINFISRGLQQAKETARQIAQQVREASKNLKELAPEARKQFAAKQRELAQERQAEIRGMQSRLNLERRAADVQGRGLNFSAALKGNIDKASSFGEKLRSVGTAAATGNLAGVLGGFGAGVPVAAIAASVANIVLPILQKQLDARVSGMATRSAVVQNENLRKADVERRMQEDPEFRDKMTRQAYREHMRAQAALRGGHWRHRGRHMAVGD